MTTRETFLKQIAMVLPVSMVPASDEKLPFNDPELIVDCLVKPPLVGIGIGRDNRGPGLLRCYIDGILDMRRRQNPEPCPACNGTYRHTYRWIESEWTDDHWSCLCGYAEVPDGPQDERARVR